MWSHFTHVFIEYTEKDFEATFLWSWNTTTLFTKYKFVQLCAAVKEEEQQQQQQCMSLFSFVVVFYFILKIQQM